MRIGVLDVKVLKKQIKHLHISVLPPEGKVRVSAPDHMSDEIIRMALVQRMAWIKRQQSQFEAQPRQTEREMVGGETHYIWGHARLLNVIEQQGKHGVVLQGLKKMHLFVTPKTSAENRIKVIHEWYREQLKSELLPLLEQWQRKIGVQAQFVGIKRMKTKWGSCSPQTARIWLNLELAKKPKVCLEYILVHELMHLKERHHNKHFLELMTKYYPQWQIAKNLLKETPIAAENWDY